MNTLYRNVTRKLPPPIILRYYFSYEKSCKNESCRNLLKHILQKQVNIVFPRRRPNFCFVLNGRLYILTPLKRPATYIFQKYIIQDNHHLRFSKYYIFIVNIQNHITHKIYFFLVKVKNRRNKFISLVQYDPPFSMQSWHLFINFCIFLY